MIDAVSKIDVPDARAAIKPAQELMRDGGDSKHREKVEQRGEAEHREEAEHRGEIGHRGEAEHKEEVRRLHVVLPAESGDVRDSRKWQAEAASDSASAHLPAVELKGVDKQIANHYQEIIAEKLGDISGADKSDSGDLTARKEALLKEEKDNVWGPESKRSFDQYVKWLEDSVIPQTVRSLSSVGVGLPSGCPVRIPSGADGKVISEREFTEALVGGKLKADLGVKPSEQPGPPALNDVYAIEGALDWVNRSRFAIAASLAEQTYSHDKENIGKGVPSGWAKAAFESEESHKLSLRKGVELYQNLYSAALAVDALNKLGDKLSYPSGIKVEHEDGRSKPVIDLPEKLGDLANDEKVKGYVKWFSEVSPRIEKDARELKLVEQNPYLNLTVADISLPAGGNEGGEKVYKKAVLDKEGNLLDIVDPLFRKDSKTIGAAGAADGADASGYAGAAGQTEVSIDTLKQRFSARRAVADNPDSDILVDTTVQAQQGRVGYDLFNKDIGKPMQIAQRRLAADDMVIYNGNLVPARTLPDAVSKDNLLHYGGKAFDIALDASMFTAGAGMVAKTFMLRKAIAGALEASSEAASRTAAGVVLPVAESQVTPQAANMARIHAATEALMGAGGFVGNNKWGEAEAPWMNATRGAYSTATSLGGLSRNFGRAFSGGEAIQSALKESGPAWLGKTTGAADRTAHVLMPVALGQGVYQSGEAIYQQWQDTEKSVVNPARMAVAAAESMPESAVFEETLNKLASLQSSGKTGAAEAGQSGDQSSRTNQISQADQISQTGQTSETGQTSQTDQTRQSAEKSAQSLSDEDAARVLSFIPGENEALNRAGTVKLLDAVGKLGQVSGPLRTGLENKLSALIDRRNPAIDFQYVQAKAIETAQALNLDVLPALERVVADQNGTSAYSREAALKAMVAMKDPILTDKDDTTVAPLASQLLEVERDQQIHSQIRKLAAPSSPAAVNYSHVAVNYSDPAVNYPDVAATVGSYPLINNFDGQNQKKFLQDNNLELLDHDLFIAEAQKAVQSKWGMTSALSLDFNRENPTDTVRNLIEKREREFKNLIAIASGRDENPSALELAPATQMARLFLAKIAASGGKPVDSSYRKYILAVNHDAGSVNPYYFDEASLPQRKSAWDADAAQALSKLAGPGQKGADLSSFLVDQLLSKGTDLNAQTVSALADSWRALSRPDVLGHHAVDSLRYKSVVQRALENSRVRKDALQGELAQAEAQKTATVYETTDKSWHKATLNRENNSLDELQAKLSDMLADKD